MKKIKSLKKIPYGISNYTLFREDNLYYVDKTRFIRHIEEKGYFLFFIRPRRFGKSLFLSTLQVYYDIDRKDRFDFFFKDTAIHRDPTPGKNKYLILKFDFSAVNPDVHQVEDSFLSHVKNSSDIFLYHYKELLGITPDEAKTELAAKKNPSDIIETVLKYCREKKQKVYVFIDEYDNFANTILSTAGEPEYQKLTHGEGFFRAFFNVLKSGTSGPDAPISRLFMTGVSPITLDDVTSGFNIAGNISLDPGINDMLGFTRGEVETMIEYYRQAGKIHHPTAELLPLMRRWYNRYRFSMDAEKEVFNSVQVLYFLDNYFINSRIPRDIVDRSVRIDYQKLRHLIIIDQKGAPGLSKSNGNFSKLTKIIETGSVHSTIEKGFPVDKLTAPENFISLLFYFGLLTISGIDEANNAILSIPNETVKGLYYDYIKETYAETRVFSLDMDRYAALMREMAFQGKWRPLLDYISERMQSALGLRDLMTREKAIQAFLNVYLGLSNLYIVHSEKELNRGFADLVLEPFLAQYPAIKYSYPIEIKYLKSSAAKAEVPAGEVQKLREEAEAQLKQYSADEQFRKAIGRTGLIKLVLVFCGPRLVYSGEAQ